MRKVFSILTIVFLLFTSISCGTGPALREKTSSDASANVATGAVDVDINTGFTLEFSVAANTTTVNTSTFFVVPAITANISPKSLSTKAAINASICNPANALSGTITPNSSGSCVTLYTLNPSQTLDYETEYALCVTSGVSFCNPDVNGFFSGLMETFTTVTEEASYTVGGTITGLNGTVVLQNNAADDLTITEDGTFTFSTAITDAATYNVTVKTNPTGQTCTASSNSGTISSANVTDVLVTCSDDAYTVGGTVSGLSGIVTIQNNATDDIIITSNGSFTFSTAVADGATYEVTVKTNPTGQTCSVTNDSGTITTDVTNVSVTCTTNTYSVGGTISGLDTDSSLTITIQNNGEDDKTLSANDSFTFDTELEAGDAYAVTISTQPDGETCHLSNDSGTIDGDVINVTIYCAYFAYTANNVDNSVTVIDTTDRTVYATISEGVGAGPSGLGISPDGSKVYIGDRGESSVSLIDTATNTAETIITGLDGGVMGVNVSPNGSTLYIDPGNDIRIYDITGETPSFTTSVVVGSAPTFTALSPDGNYLYIPNYSNVGGQKLLYVMDTAVPEVSDTPAINNFAHCACASPDGNYVYVVNIGNNNVSVIETTGYTVERTIAVGTSPFTCAVTPDSSFVYVANSSSDNISVINTSTWASSAIAGVSCDGAYGIDVTHDGEYVYVACAETDTVVVIQTSDNTQVGDAIDVGDSPNLIKIQRPNPNP